MWFQFVCSLLFRYVYAQTLKDVVMQIGILKEPPGETRVSLLPESVATLIGKGHTIFVETHAGALAFASDEDYTKAGATIGDAQTVIQSS